MRYEEYEPDYFLEQECECSRCAVDFKECKAALQGLISTLFGKNLQVEKVRMMLEFLCEEFDVAFPENQELNICKKPESALFEYMANVTRAHAKLLQHKYKN